MLAAPSHLNQEDVLVAAKASAWHGRIGSRLRRQFGPESTEGGEGAVDSDAYAARRTRCATWVGPCEVPSATRAREQCLKGSYQRSERAWWRSCTNRTDALPVDTVRSHTIPLRDAPERQQLAPLAIAKGPVIPVPQCTGIVLFQASHIARSVVKDLDED